MINVKNYKISKKAIKPDIVVCDFETLTVEPTRVWLWGVYINKGYDISDFVWGTDIGSFMMLIKQLKPSATYFHNLKFDGSFIVNWFVNLADWIKQNNEGNIEIIDNVEDEKGQLESIISEGRWYALKWKLRNKTTITIKDSSKLIPMSVKEMSTAFGLEMYKGTTPLYETLPLDYVPTDEELEYLYKDIMIVFHSLENFNAINSMLPHKNKNSKIRKTWRDYYTIGSMSYAIYKDMMCELWDSSYKSGSDVYKEIFPFLDKGDYYIIKESYKGGISAVRDGVYDEEYGLVLDVNSLYPFAMTNRLLPYGHLFESNSLDTEIVSDYYKFIYCEVSVSCYRYINWLDIPNDELNSLILTETDFHMMKKTYDITSLTVKKVYFTGKEKQKGQLFGVFVRTFYDLKSNAKNKGNRTIYKFIMNALSGKFGTKMEINSQEIIYDEKITLKSVKTDDVDISKYYIPVISAITSYGREYLLEHMIKHFDRFLYCDTDSLHIRLTKDEYIKRDTSWLDMEIDDKKIGCWDLEMYFKKARYITKKTYIELSDDDKLKVTVCGLDRDSQDKVTFDNFAQGSKFPIKRLKYAVGGAILVDTFHEIR